MNLLDNHIDCLQVTKHLVKVFEERRVEIQPEIESKSTDESE